MWRKFKLLLCMMLIITCTCSCNKETKIEEPDTSEEIAVIEDNIYFLSTDNTDLSGTGDLSLSTPSTSSYKSTLDSNDSSLYSKIYRYSNSVSEDTENSLQKSFKDFSESIQTEIKSYMNIHNTVSKLENDIGIIEITTRDIFDTSFEMMIDNTGDYKCRYNFIVKPNECIYTQEDIDKQIKALVKISGINISKYDIDTMINICKVNSNTGIYQIEFKDSLNKIIRITGNDIGTESENFSISYELG